MKKKYFLLLLNFILLAFLSNAQNTILFEDFEGSDPLMGWNVLNGSCVNMWHLGTGAGPVPDTNTSLYVSSTMSGYFLYYGASSATVFACRNIVVDSGWISVDFDWCGYGRANSDYMRVMLVPDDVTLAAVNNHAELQYGIDFSTTLPSGWTAIDGGQALCLHPDWRHSRQELWVPDSGDYKLVVMWTNYILEGNRYITSAAIDNIRIVQLPCGRVDDLLCTRTTGTTADLQWTDANGSSSFRVVYGPADDTARSYVVVSGTGCRLTGLHPQTEYVAGVSVACDGGYVPARYVGFTTRCGENAMPMLLDFESGDIVDDLLPCFIRHTNAMPSYAFPRVEDIVSHNHTWRGHRGLLWRVDTQTEIFGTNAVLVLPPVDIEGDSTMELVVSFWAKCAGMTGARPVIEVGVVDNEDDSASFRVQGSCALVGGGWREYRVATSSFAGSGGRVALRYAGSLTEGYISMDDIIVYRRGDCMPPFNLNASASGSSITASWNRGGSESAWLVTCGDTAIVVYDTVCVIPDMLAGLNLTLAVRALCGSDTSAATWCVTRTDCVPAGHGILPYYQGFEDWDTGNGYRAGEYSPTTPCWSIVQPMSSTTLNPWVKPDGGHTGSNSLHYDEYRNPGNRLLVLPTFADSLHTLKMSFWLRYKTEGTGANDCFLRVGVWDGQTFTPADTMTTDNWTRWIQYETDFAHYLGPEGAIAFLFPVYAEPGWLEIDDIVVFSALGCQPPRDAHAYSISQDSVRVAWVEDTAAAGANYWVRYSSQGVVRDTIVAGSSVMLGNILRDSDYDIEIRTLCGADTSVPCGVRMHTVCDNPSLPFTLDLGSGVSTDYSLACCYFGGSHNATSGPRVRVAESRYERVIEMESAYPAKRNWVVLPLVDVNVTDLQLKLKIKKSTSYICSAKVEVGVMDDPADIATFVPVAQVCSDDNRNWDSVLVYFSNYTGAGRYIALVTRHEEEGQCWQKPYIKDIEVDYANACRPVRGLRVSTSGSSAMAVWEPWQGYEPPYYRVEYRAGQESWQYLETADTFCGLSALMLDSVYQLRVAAVCATGLSQWCSSSFRLAPCLTSGFAKVGEDTTTTHQNIPVSSIWGNSLCQSIYRASELRAAGLRPGPITHVAYHWGDSCSMNKMFTILLGHTNEVSLVNYTYLPSGYYSDVDTFINLSTQQVVFHGPQPRGEKGVMYYQLDSVFVWDGVSNIVVTSLMNQPEGEAQADAGIWGYSSIDDTCQSAYCFRDGRPYDTVGVPSGFFNYVYGRPNIVFRGLCDSTVTCMPPVAQVVDVTKTEVTLAWAPGMDETQWTVGHKASSSTTWIADTLTDVTTYRVRGLMPSTDYDFRVAAVCDTAQPAFVVNATTLCGMIVALPYTENFDSCGEGYFVLPRCWNNGTRANPCVYTNFSNGYLYCASWDYGSRGYVALPEFDTTIAALNQLQVSFDMTPVMVEGQLAIVVGVMDDADDFSTFVGVDTIAIANGAGHYDGFLSDYCGSGTYVALHFLDTVLNYLGADVFYIDNFELNYAASCRVPERLEARGGTVNSVVLQWRDRGTATQWEIEYGPEGFTLGTGTRVVANTNPFLLTGLPSGFCGEYRVRAICGAGDTSRFSHGTCTFGTHQVPATVPYAYNFETASEWSNWQTYSTDSQMKWCRGSAMALQGTKGAYISRDGGATFDANVYVEESTEIMWREIDFGYAEVDYELSFNHYSGAVSLGLYVYLVDTSLSISDFASCSPDDWDRMPQCRRLAYFGFDTSGSSYRQLLDPVRGTHSLLFVWKTTFNNYEFSCAVDDIRINAVRCRRPSGLTASHLAGTRATLTWDGDSAGSYLVTYRQVGTASHYVFSELCNGNSVTLNDLQPQTNYVAWVQRICGAGDTSVQSVGYQFATFCCDTPTVVYTFDSSWQTTTSSLIPFGGSTFSSSYVQTIIPAELLANLDGPVTALSFYSDNGLGGDGYTSLQLMMANVSDSSLEHEFVMSGDGLVLSPVFNGLEQSYVTAGWNTLFFQQPFEWDGVSNVLLVAKRHQSVSSQRATFGVHMAPTALSRFNNQTRYFADATEGLALAQIADMKLYSCVDTNTCRSPRIVSVQGDNTSATFEWQGDGNMYEVNIRPMSSSVWTNDDVVVTGNTYTFNGLSTGVEYMLRVRQVCDEAADHRSSWTYCNVLAVESVCQPPLTIDITVVSPTRVLFDWQAYVDASEWELNIANDDGFDRTYSVTSLPYIVHDLRSGLNYSVQVRSVCAGGYLGDWSAPFEFSTNICPNVENLNVNSVTAHEVQLSWSNDSLAQEWEIEYGYNGFSAGLGTTLRTTRPFVTITGLEDETGYDFYVRTLCSGDRISAQWVKASAVTSSLRIDTPQGVTCSLYPNPTHAAATLHLAGIQGIAEVMLFSVDGRLAYSTHLQCNGEERLQLNMSHLPRGTYFVRVVTQQVTLVRKLVVD